jgi:hypothetical protein
MALIPTQRRSNLHRWFESFKSGDLEQIQRVALELSPPNYRLHDPTYSTAVLTRQESMGGSDRSCSRCLA